MNTHELRPRNGASNLFTPALALLFFIVLGFGFGSGTAQEPEKEGEAKEREIEIRMAPHLPFTAKLRNLEKMKDLKNEDWLGDLEFEITNTGEKPIYELSFAVFPLLRLWVDADHDGVSGPAELHTLASMDVARIHLDYKEARRVDRYGNLFRYRAKVDDARGAKAGRWAWDVFLVSAP